MARGVRTMLIGAPVEGSGRGWVMCRPRAGRVEERWRVGGRMGHETRGIVLLLAQDIRRSGRSVFIFFCRARLIG